MILISMEVIIMNDILLNILSVVVTAVVLPLISYAGTKLISYLNAKVKDENVKLHLTSATTIVTNAVLTVFQTYVDSLKKNGSFDKDAQLEALTRAKDIALSQMTQELKDFITTNFGDLDNWLTIQIESSINLIKKK